MHRFLSVMDLEPAACFLAEWGGGLVHTGKKIKVNVTLI